MPLSYLVGGFWAVTAVIVFHWGRPSGALAMHPLRLGGSEFTVGLPAQLTSPTCIARFA
jgi:hypothetical protein